MLYYLYVSLALCKNIDAPVPCSLGLHCLSAPSHMSQNRFMKCRSMRMDESSTETEIENL